MFSLQKFFSKDTKFFDLLEASAEEARSSAALIQRVLSNPSPTSLEELSKLRRKDKEITTEIKTLLCRSFVSKLDKEDIEALASALYKIPKTIEKIAIRYITVASAIKGIELKPQTELVHKATDIVAEMVKGLRHTTDLFKLNESNLALQRIESEADDLLITMTKDIYEGKYEPLKALALKDLFEMLEKVVDRCRDAGNVIAQIVLKYS